MSLGGWIFLGTLAGVVIVGGVGYLTIREKARRFSRTLFGTDDLLAGLNRQADDAANTPKSVSSLTKLMEPQIVRDFPEFVWEEFKHKAENMLTSALLAISTNNVDALVDASEEVTRQVETEIRGNQAMNRQKVYNNIKIHQTEISNYRKEHGKCIITIQSALEYYHYTTQGGKVIDGTKERKVQTKYNTELMYIQDENIVEFDNAVGTTCPNCGAPVKALGNKVCEYCGLGITPINVKVWALHKFYEVDYNHV